MTHATFAEPRQASLPRLDAPLATGSPAARMDLYVSIHKALRSFMTDTLSRIGRIDVLDRADRDAALAQLDELLGLCLAHLRHENDFVHTAIGALQAEADALRTAIGADAERLALRLYRHLALFVAENFQHMHIEETVHNALLWQYYSDAELGALHGRLMASIAPSSASL